MRVRRVVPDLAADDPSAGREFYADVLGFDVAMDHGWIVTYAAPGNPTAQISVMRQDASAPVRPDVSIEVDDVDAAPRRGTATGLRDHPSAHRRAVGRAPVLRWPISHAW